jgi:hypothetical protein
MSSGCNPTDAMYKEAQEVTERSIEVSLFSGTAGLKLDGSYRMLFSRKLFERFASANHERQQTMREVGFKDAFRWKCFLLTANEISAFSLW